MRNSHYKNYIVLVDTYRRSSRCRRQTNYAAGSKQ